MIVRGIDFTSRPRRKKPITCFEGCLDGTVLRFEREVVWTGFSGFEAALDEAGPWIAGLDLPFGQARRFVEAIGWPQEWAAYARRLNSMSREAFRGELESFRIAQPEGAREFKRETDRLASSVSPQKLYGVPVALMFYEGVKRLVESTICIPGLKAGDEKQIVVEAYPGVLARFLIGRRPYKNDVAKKQTADQRQARMEMLNKIRGGGLTADYAIAVDLPERLAEAMVADGSGDQLDALLCAVQAAWAWTMRDHDFGAPPDFDTLEGWIADPNLLKARL